MTDLPESIPIGGLDLYLSAKPGANYLAPPPSLSRCLAIVRAATVEEVAAFGAALGACWSGPKRPKTRLTGDWQVYGYAVIDELVARGWALRDVEVAGRYAWQMVYDRMPRLDEVQREADFSEAPPVAGTS